jgi:hypothetical protein
VADDPRPEYQHGVGTIGSTQFHWGSGMPGKYWSIPYGDYPVTPNAPTGAWAHQAGAIPIANNVIPDPQLGRNRIGIMIHSGSAPSLDQLYTEGCFKVDPQEWPTVRSQILAQADKGPLYLHVAPGGIAAFTNTKTFSPAGDQTPAATANAAANTVAAPTAQPAQGTTLTSNNPSVIDTLSKNIAGIESGGWKNPYDALNPTTHAVGKYQVMPSNIPGWTMAATGQSMTPEQFQANPQAQEAVFRDQMQRNLQLYGPKDAASIWFTGKPYNVAGGGATDANNTTNASYVTRATAGLPDSATPGATINTTGAKPTGVGGVIAALTQGTGDGASPLQDLQKTFQQGPSSGGSGGGAPPAPAPDLQGQMAAGMGNMRQQQIAAQAQQMLAAQQQGLAASQQLRPQVGGHLAYGLSGSLIPMANPAPTPGTTLNSTGDLYG